MSFQIKKIVLWPKNTFFPPNEVTFKLNTVNVITGESRTGKSAIIPIIDYCLGSAKCNIPIDTIRDHVSWYGVVIKLETEEILIARKVPEGNISSGEFYWNISENVTIPSELKDPNCTLRDIKLQLNDRLGLPFLSADINEDNQVGFKAPLSIRDLMAFIFQTQDIVANQNILFYKTHEYQHRERLKNWLPFIFGAETLEVLKARQRLQILENKLTVLKKELEKERMISEEWKANIYGHLRTAVDYGLISSDFSAQDNPDKLIQIAKSLLDNIPDSPSVTFEIISTSNREIKSLEEEEDELAFQISQLKKRLKEVDTLREGFTGYGEVTKKRVERLHISKWLSEITHDVQACPVCGDDSHPQANLELSKISSALAKYESESRKHLEIPSSFEREELRLKQELEDLVEKKQANQNRYDWLVSQDTEAKKEFYKKKEMYIYIGHLKASIERFALLTEGGKLENKLDVLQAEYNQLKRLVDGTAIENKVLAATKKISIKMLEHLKNLDVEDKYRQTAPEFNVKELAILVQSNEGNWHFLSEVGSASNWVSFHIALMCSLQEFFSNLKHSSVPRFVIFDQPSQVYFPKVRPEIDREQDFTTLKDQDFQAVKKIFKALSQSTSTNNASWQFIVLDHADSDIYGDIENIHEVDNWRDGRKLVPEAWYKLPS
jgi:hypothetical protein